MNDLPKRKRNRLPDYDYSQNGMYHITICTENHKKLLSDIVPGTVGAIINRPQNQTVPAIINRPQVVLTGIGEIVDRAICEIPDRYNSIIVEKYVIMPNHVHLLISINREGAFDDGGRSDGQSDGRLIIAPTVSRVIKQMKSSVTKQAGCSIWQKGFYDHVIKNDTDYENVWTYIDENPVKWEDDEYY